MILLSMTIGSCFSVTDQAGISSLPAKKKLNYSIGGSGPQQEWNHTFGGVSLDIGTGVKPVAGGGYIIAGTKDLTGYYTAGDCWLTKTDSDGNPEWEKTYGGTNCDATEDVWQTSDGGFIIVGTTNSFGAGNFDMWLIKTDGNGTELWNRTYGGRKMDYGTSVQQTSDGGYIISGFTSSYGMGGNDAWLVKTDNYGNMEWNKTFGDLFRDEYFMCVQQTQDRGYIAAGGNDLDDNGNSDMFIVKLNSSGTQEWKKLIGSPYLDDCLWITQTFDGGYILTGQSSQARFQPEDLSLFKIDHNGNEEWRKYYGGPYFDTGTAIEQTKDNGYIITGGFTVNEYEIMDAVLLKTDSTGNEEWRATFGGVESDMCLEVHQTEDEGYIVTGFTNSYGEGGQEIWLVKFGAFENQRPNTPSRPSGPSSGKMYHEYIFTVSTTDSDGDQLYYLFDFGEGATSFWYGPYDSGEECNPSHIYHEQGNYQVKVKAKDTSGAESDWSDPLPIAIRYSYNPIRKFIEWLFERSPDAFPLLRQLSG
jgi:hypothetical protein